MKYFRAIAVLAAAAIVAACNSTNAIPNAPPANAIQHVVILMQENRSFNNIFAGFPGATTAMTGLCIPVHQSGSSWCESGTAALHPVTLETTGHLGLGTDIDHSHKGFKIECHRNSSGVCQNDGFDLIRYGESGYGPPAMLYPYAYVKRSETKAYWDFAKRYALADEMFMTDTASSFIAHQLILSGTVMLNSHESLTDQPYLPPWGCDASFPDPTPILKSNGKEVSDGLNFPCFTQYPTLSDVLDPKHVGWRYYTDVVKGGDFSGSVWNGYDAIAKVRCKTFKPTHTCDGEGADWTAHMAFSREDPKFFSDVKNGNLQAVSYVIPTLEDSDHPASGCNHGPRWVTSVVNAIGESKYWNSTAIIVLWDDWGGWYDPVPPPQTNYTSLGFRIPLIVISPWAQPGVVHTQFEYGSILKFLEQNFGLNSLGTTDQSANSLGSVFNYKQTPLKYVPEPLPPEKKCTGNATMQQIIDHDGGVPE